MVPYWRYGTPGGLAHFQPYLTLPSAVTMAPLLQPSPRRPPLSLVQQQGWEAPKEGQGEVVNLRVVRPSKGVLR